MKRISLLCLLILLCSLPGQAQFWISFGWNEPHCQNCLWMEQAMRLNSRQAADYHKIVHRYGQRIEKEARKHYRYWDQSARKIYDLRMDRDRKLQRVLSQSQFRQYVRFVRERPQRIHDYQGWYRNPHYPEYRLTDLCWRYEDRYWHCQWEYDHGRWNGRFDEHKWYRGKYDSPGNDNHGQSRPDRYDRPREPQINKPSHRNDRYENDRPNNRNDRGNSRSNRDKDRKEKEKDKKRTESKRSEMYRNT